MKKRFLLDEEAYYVGGWNKMLLAITCTALLFFPVFNLSITVLYTINMME